MKITATRRGITVGKITHHWNNTFINIVIAGFIDIFRSPKTKQKILQSLKKQMKGELWN